jgi:predicted kinase
VEVIFLIGLPGSGKSSYIEENYSKNNLYRSFDDVKGDAVLNNGDFAYSKHYPKIVKLMEEGKKNIVISDIHFCRNDNLKKAKEIINWWINHNHLDYQIKSIFFKNNPNQCKKNISGDGTRNIQSRIASVDKYSQDYAPEILYDQNCDLIIDVYSE